MVALRFYPTDIRADPLFDFSFGSVFALGYDPASVAKGPLLLVWG